MDDADRIRQLRAELEALERKGEGAAPIEGADPSITIPAAPDVVAAKAPAKKPTSPGSIVLYIVAAGFLILLAVTQCGKSPTPAGPDQNGAVPLNMAEVQAKMAEMSPPTPWVYSESPDPLTDGITRTACTTSTNEVLLDWPYHNVSAQLCIRQSPKYGLDTYVTLNGDGQILCRSYESCTLKVRFGEAAARSWPAVGAADGSSNIVFLRRSQTLVTQAKGTDRVMVELPMYRSGNQAISFNTKGLEWPRPAAKP